MQALLKIMYNNTLGTNPGNAINNPALTNNDWNYQTNYSADLTGDIPCRLLFHAEAPSLRPRRS